MLSDRCPVCPVCNVGVLWLNGWMDQDATWYGDRPRSRPYCVRWRPSSPRERDTAAPTFRPMSIVAKRSPISATISYTWLILSCLFHFFLFGADVRAVFRPLSPVSTLSFYLLFSFGLLLVFHMFCFFHILCFK